MSQTGGTATSRGTGAEVLMEAGSDELGEALRACEFPLIVFVSRESGSFIVLANQSAADVNGLSIPELVGRNLEEMLTPLDGFKTAVHALDSGAVDGGPSAV